MPANRKKPSSQKGIGPRTLSIAEAKARFSSVISGVQQQRNPVTILRRGVPVAEIIPIGERKPSSGFGWMRGSVQEQGDIVGPTGIEWTLKDE